MRRKALGLYCAILPIVTFRHIEDNGVRMQLRGHLCLAKTPNTLTIMPLERV